MSFIKNENIRRIINLVLFVTGWVTCVFIGGQWAYGVTFVILVIHFLLLGSWPKEREVLAITLLLGSMIDSFAGNLGLQHLASVTESTRILSGWQACIWLLLGTMVRHSLEWLGEKPINWALSGVVFATIHYWLLGIYSPVSLAEPATQTVLVFAFFWAIAMAVLQSFSSVWKERYKRQYGGK